MPLAPVDESYASDPLRLLALCIWREARGEPMEAKLGVAWTIRNRVSMAPREGFKHNIKDNILKPWAFSSFMQGDPNSRLYPGPTDRSWRESMEAAGSVTHEGEDPTAGAVFYFSAPLTDPPAAWGKVEHSATLAGLKFWRIAA